MVVSGHAKQLLDKIRSTVTDIEENLSHLSEVLSQIPTLPTHDVKLSQNVLPYIDHNLVTKAHVDAKVVQMDESTVLLMKQRFTQEYFVCCTLFQDYISELKKCDLTDLEDLVDPDIISILSSTLRSTSALILGTGSTTDNKLQSELLTVSRQRLGMISSSLEMALY